MIKRFINIQERSVEMRIIIIGIGLLSAFGIVILLGLFPDMSNNEKVPILAILVLIATFSLIRMKSKDTKSGKATNK
jgi:hypothetical protein